MVLSFDVHKGLDVVVMPVMLINTEYVHALTGLVCHARVTPASLPRAASSAQRSRRLRSTRGAAPGLLAHVVVTVVKNKQFHHPSRHSQRGYVFSIYSRAHACA